MTGEIVDSDKVEQFVNPSLEELLGLREPREIYMHKRPTKSGKPGSTILYPYEEVRSELLEWKQKNNLLRINHDELKRFNGTLRNKLVTWSYIIDGSVTSRKAAQHMGFESMNGRQDVDTYTSNILKLFPKEIVLDFFNNGKTKTYLMEHIKNSCKELHSAYEARKYRAANGHMSIADIVDNNYKDIKGLTGFLPSQILWLRPLSDETLCEAIESLYYAGSDIRSETLKTTALGNKLVYFIKHHHNRPTVPVTQRTTSTISPAKKDVDNGLVESAVMFANSGLVDPGTILDIDLAEYNRIFGSTGSTMPFDDIPVERVKKVRVKNGYTKEIHKYFNSGLKPYLKTMPYLISDKGSRGLMATLSEVEFSFFWSILAKHDPYMENFPELKDRIATPIESVRNPLSHSDRRILHEKKRFSDGRFNAGGKSYLIELKKTDYSSPRQFFSSLAKYANSHNWWDGEPIDGRILLIDKVMNGNAKKVSSDWIMLDGAQFSRLYTRAIDLLLSKEPDFEHYSPMNSRESLSDMHDMLHDKSHIVIRKGNRILRNMMKEVQLKNFCHMAGGEEFDDPYQKYDFHYSFSVGELGLYPKAPLQDIPDGCLFLDLETTGFRNSGSPIIMATLGECKDGDFISDLYFARTPFEEKKLLETVIGRMDGYSRIITYNGKNFDLPFLEERAFVNLMKYTFDKAHTDLYIEYYKQKSKEEKFDKSRLKTFERTELKLDRRGDVKGSDIPEIYKNYLLGENEILMKNIISHNFLDVFTMPYMYLAWKGYQFNNAPRDVSLLDFKGLFNG